MSVAKTVTELAERIRNAGPPTEDDGTILPDGRRLDSKEAVESWLVEVDAIRKSQASVNAPDRCRARTRPTSPH